MYILYNLNNSCPIEIVVNVTIFNFIDVCTCNQYVYIFIDIYHLKINTNKYYVY